MAVRTARRAAEQGATEQFLAGLAAGGRHPLLHGVKGIIRFEIVEPDETRQLHVVIEDGELQVVDRTDEADAVIRADRSTFDAMVEGTMNTTAALLRGALTIEGDLRLVAALSRLFPGPPRTAKEGEAHHG